MEINQVLWAFVAGAAGIRRKSRMSTTNDTANRMEPNKNGAPGNAMGDASDVKKLNSPAVKMSGAKILVRLVKEVSAPWISPCSEGPTVPATRPWMAGIAKPARAPNTMMTKTIQPSDANP